MRIIAALCLLPVLVQGEEGGRLVVGIVLDQEGKPLSEAEVAEGWVFRTKGRQHTGSCAQTDAEGRFRITTSAGTGLHTLVAYSKDESLAGLVRVSGDEAEHVTIRMAPAATVAIRVRTSENGPAPETVQVAWHVSLGDGRLGPVIAQAVSWNGRLECTLPRGQYDWRVSDIDFVTRFGKANLDQNMALEVIVPPSFVARHMGKRLPEWTVTEARGAPPDAATLASFRGKWTLVEFWAFS